MFDRAPVRESLDLVPRPMDRSETPRGRRIGRDRRLEDFVMREQVGLDPVEQRRLETRGLFGQEPARRLQPQRGLLEFTRLEQDFRQPTQGGEPLGLVPGPLADFQIVA